MTARNYDSILTVNNAISFTAGNTVIGITTGASGLIANVNPSSNTLKIKLSNTLVDFSNSEQIYSNSIILSGSANTETAPFNPPNATSEVTTAVANISVVAPSGFIAEKNAFEQNPIVNLYTVYYPGEWHPGNISGNPTGEGAGLSWPVGFPYRFAEIRGDLISDLQYKVLFGDKEYTPYPIDSTGISLDSSGKINQVTLTIANFDNVITALVEDPNLVGNNTTNAQSATVNGEIVGNIDPRTIPGNALYDSEVAAARGGNNVAFDFDSTTAVGGTWKRLKQDTRDLLGAVIEIKSTYANLLNYWPEYSVCREILGNGIEMYSSLPYRVGDTITSNATSGNAEIIAIRGHILITNNSVYNTGNVTVGDKIYIENPDADSESFVLDTMKIDNLETLNEKAASFALTSWLQSFKLRLPKRRFHKNTCPWIYKGEECQYPDNGTDSIPGTTKTANGFFDINNNVVLLVGEDVCAHSELACSLRNNAVHFGGFPATGRTIPK